VAKGKSRRGRTEGIATRELDAEIGRRIRRRREAIGLRANRLAAAIGVSPAQVAKYEAGTHPVPAERLAAISAALRIAVGDLFVGLPAAALRHDGAGVPPGLVAEARAFLGAVAALPDAATRSHVAALTRHLAERQRGG
jgi:transcriptional regulator with XRE-family HTH domain